MYVVPVGAYCMPYGYRVVWANSKVLTTRPVLKNTACSGHSVATASQALISSKHGDIAQQ